MNEIKKYNDESSTIEYLDSLKKCAALVGIENTSTPSLGLLISFLHSNFIKVTPLDLEKAFEAYAAGKLPDEYNRVKHFGNFSAVYVSQVIRLYQSYMKQFKKPVLMLEAAKYDDAANWAILDKSIIEQFDSFIETGGFNFQVKYPVYLRLQEIGLLDNLPPCNENPLELAKALIGSRSTLNKYDRINIKSKGNNHDMVKYSAEVIKDLLVIKQVFLKLKEEGKHIIDFLK